MVQLDVPAAFMVSQLFVDLGRRTIRAAKTEQERRLLYHKFLTRSLLFAGLIIVPGGSYLLSSFPGWESLYWMPFAERMAFHPGNALLFPFFVGGIVAGGWLGHHLGFNWVVSGRDKYLRPTYLGVLVAACLVVLASYPSFILLGTCDQYRHDRAAMEYVWNNPHNFMLAWGIPMAIFFVVLVVMALRIRRESQMAG